MSKKAPISDDDLYPDAWERFERAVKTVMKAPPQHRTKDSGKPKKLNKKDTGGGSDVQRRR